ncbi:MAG: amidase family protein, partial [Amphiplicatus sp.]
IDDLAADLERAGAKVSRESALLPSPAESQTLVERFLKVAKARTPEALLAGAADATIKDYSDCFTAQELVRRQWDVFFRSFDVVIAPCYATAAFAHFSEPDPWPGLNRTLRIDGVEVPYAPQHAWALYAGMARLPVTAAPIGRTRGGLPIGAQFIGPYLEDLTTIAFAAHVSEEFGLMAEIAEAVG